MTYLERLWALKRQVAAGDYPETGICSAVDLPDTQTRSMRQWPEYSGWPQFPVRGTGEPAAAAYDAAHLADWRDRGKYLWCGAYGGARMRLLNWLIRQEEAKHV